MTIPSELGIGPIYLDYNATTPVDPRVVEACLPFLGDHFGNPSSGHAYGRITHAAVATARTSIATAIRCEASEVIFTAGGSDGDTLAIRGAGLVGRGKHLITQATEHPAVLAVCESLRRLHGFRITQLAVDHPGLVDPADLTAALTDDTALVSIMHANNETGTIQPIRQLADIAHARGALFHTDASQSFGKIAVSVPDLGVDLLTLTGHKIYAPKGVGALYVREGLQLEPSTYGGGQERGMRGGTENVALIVALGEAALIASATANSEMQRLQQLRDTLLAELALRLPNGVYVNGHPTARLPNTLNVSVTGVPGEQLLAAVPEIAASTGSACHEGSHHPSPTLTAMGVHADRARSTLRLTLGRWTTEQEMTQAAKLLSTAAEILLRS